MVYVIESVDYNWINIVKKASSKIFDNAKLNIHVDSIFQVSDLQIAQLAVTVFQKISQLFIAILPLVGIKSVFFFF